MKPDEKETEDSTDESLRGKVQTAVRQYNPLGKLATALVTLLLVALFGWCFVRVTFLTFVDNYQLGYMYDMTTGQITRLNRTGYIFAWPIVQGVYTVDLRPMQVRISGNARILNAKLVQFMPDEVDPVTGMKGLELFLSWHGRNDYEGPGNASSGSSGVNTFADILLSYAYDESGKFYPFLKITQELKVEQSPSQAAGTQ